MSGETREKGILLSLEVLGPHIILKVKSYFGMNMPEPLTSALHLATDPHVHGHAAGLAHHHHLTEGLLCGLKRYSSP